MPRSLALLALAASLALAARAQAQSHPHLFFGAGDVSALRAKAASGPFASLGQAIPAGASDLLTWSPNPPTQAMYGDSRENGDVLVTLCFAYQLTGNAAYAQLARSYMQTYEGWDWTYGQGVDLTVAHMVSGMSIAYDWCYDQLAASDRSAALSAISRNAALLYQAATQGQAAGGWWQTDYMNNHNWVNHSALGLAALALAPDLPASTTGPWLQVAQADLAGIQEIWNLIGDGTWHEGMAYLGYGLEMSLPFLSQLSREKGVDLADSALLRSYATYRAAANLPGLPREYIFPFGDFYGWDDASAMLLRYVATRYRDPAAQGLADAWDSAEPWHTYAPEQIMQVFEFLFADASIASTPPTPPSSLYLTDLQGAILRDATMVLGLKCGVYGGEGNFQRVENGGAPGGDLNFGHDHADDNGISLYGNGAWLLPEAVGYGESVGPANPTVFHNSLLVDGQGQLFEGDRCANGCDDDASAYPTFYTRHGTTDGVARTAHYGFAVGHGGQLYAPSAGLTQFDRQILFDHGVTIVRDLLAASGSHEFATTWHFTGGAQSDGSWIEGLADRGQALGIALLSPVGATVAYATQTPRNYSTFDEASIFDQSGPTSLTLATIQAPSPASAATFLSVLVPTTAAGWSARPAVTALDQASPGSGADIALPEGSLQVAFGDGAPNKVAGLSLAAVAAVVLYPTGGGLPLRMALIHGTALSDMDAARTLLVTSTPATIEAEVSGGAVVLSGDAVTDLSVYAPATSSVTLNGVPVAFEQIGPMVVFPPAAAVDAGNPAPDAGGNPTPDAGLLLAPDAGLGTPDAGTPPKAGADAGSPATIGPDRLSPGYRLPPGPLARAAASGGAPGLAPRKAVGHGCQSGTGAAAPFAFALGAWAFVRASVRSRRRVARV